MLLTKRIFVLLIAATLTPFTLIGCNPATKEKQSTASQQTPDVPKEASLAAKESPVPVRGEFSQNDATAYQKYLDKKEETKLFADLKGKKVAIRPEGSGTFLSALL